MVGQVYLWVMLLVLFEMIAAFIRLVSLLIADITGSFEALVLAFLVLTFVPKGSFLSL